MKGLFSVLLLFLIIGIKTSETPSKGIQIVEPSELGKLIAAHPKMLLFFSDKDCQNCHDCSEAYALTNQLYPDSAKYTKIYLSNTSKPTFLEYNITQFPLILAFINGKQSPFSFECLGSKNNMKEQMIRWIDRLDSSLKEWGEEEDREHQIIVHCDSDERKKMWKKIERNHLWLDLYCGKQEFLGDNLAVVSEFGKSIQAWQLQDFDNNTEQKAYQYKYVLNWNTAIAQQIFFKNQSAFVLLVNNETRSMKMYNYFEQIKQSWYENAQKYQPVMFVVSDLTRNTYETIRLKRYLTGITTATKKQYPYPILTFIDASSLPRPKKYVMSLVDPTKDKISEWMESIHNHLLLEQEYIDGENPLEEWLNEDMPKQSKPKAQRSSEEQESYFEADGQVQYIKTQDQWRHLMSKQRNAPFFVYFTWRFDYKLQQKEADVVFFWEQKSKEGVVPNSQIPLFVHRLDAIDLPIIDGLSIDYVPSICYIDSDKNIQMKQGVTDIDKIEKFFKEKLNKKVASLK